MNRSDKTLLTAGGTACVACCAAPIGGWLAAVGLGTVAGAALLGTTAAVIVGVLASMLVMLRRRKRLADARPVAPPPVVAQPVTLSRRD